MRHLSIAILALLCPLRASTQSVEPEMTVQRLSAKEYPPVAEDEPSIMSSDEFYRLRNKVFSVEDIAVVRLTFKGKWYKSADYLAREKAALLGANGLVLVESVGREDMGIGAIRTYKAFRLTNSSGRPIYTKPAEPPLVPQPLVPTAPAASPAKAAVTTAAAHAPTPRVHRHFAWVWEDGPHLLSHRLGFDPARASAEQREQLRLYVQENFPAQEQTKLLSAYKARSRVVLDFLKRAIK